MQANAKTIEGSQHPDRDAQFSYINAQATEHIDGGQPVVSVDTTKEGARRPVHERRPGVGAGR